MMELLIVIAIMGILAVVGLDSFMFSMAKGRDAQRKSDLAAVAKALETYQNDFSRYPLSSEGLIAGCGDGTDDCSWGAVFSATVNGSGQTYMSVLPVEPTNGENYYYKSSDGTTYSLYSTLENQHDKGYFSSDDDEGYDVVDEVDCGDNHCRYKLTQSGAIYPAVE
jgi:type II secretory pathway pseudopilin PulG